MNAYKIISELMARPMPFKNKPVYNKLGITNSPQGIRKAARIRLGQDPMHSKPGFKQAATKVLKQIPPEKIKSAGVQI